MVLPAVPLECVWHGSCLMLMTMLQMTMLQMKISHQIMNQCVRCVCLGYEIIFMHLLSNMRKVTYVSMNRDVWRPSGRTSSWWLKDVQVWYTMWSVKNDISFIINVNPYTATSSKSHSQRCTKHWFQHSAANCVDWGLQLHIIPDDLQTEQQAFEASAGVRICKKNGPITGVWF